MRGCDHDIRCGGHGAARDRDDDRFGLDNPRDLAFGRNGKLYVAEAGHGGPSCFSDPEIVTACVGFTSKISLVDVAHSQVQRIATGFVSLADPQGAGATGVDGISTLGNRIYGIITGSALAVSPSVLPRRRPPRRSASSAVS